FPGMLMNRLVLLVAPLAMLGARALPAASALPAMAGGQRLPSLAPMVKRVSPAIVNVAARGTATDGGDDDSSGGPSSPSAGGQDFPPDDPLLRRFFSHKSGSRGTARPREHPFQSAGSGVVIDARRGFILTNAHVVENANAITVTLEDGRDLQATIIGSDQASDIAVLKVKPAHLTQITLGDSSKVQVGDFVVAIGNPFGLHNTVTSGIVSGLGRSSLSSDGYEDFIQTDASINPGNSGGALVNLRGELIGINTAILSNSGDNIGIGFAIPVNMARTIMRQLIAFGAVQRGILGVSDYAIGPEVGRVYGLAGIRGVLVVQVVAGSAADRAGIEIDDIITSINDAPIRTPTDLRNAVGLLRVGEAARIDLLRDGKPRRLSALIAEAPPIR
ncbi:MAG: trypsin-like peptidase domain-containing protein, partial [Steroidobacteraceae bacterium]